VAGHRVPLAPHRTHGAVPGEDELRVRQPPEHRRPRRQQLVLALELGQPPEADGDRRALGQPEPPPGRRPVTGHEVAGVDAVADDLRLGGHPGGPAGGEFVVADAHDEIGPPRREALPRGGGAAQ
jgi:hypothetical protein